jgi:phosphoglycerate kinase
LVPKAIESFSVKLFKTQKPYYGMDQWEFLKWKNFKMELKLVALAVAEATQKGAFSLVGGGDSVAAVNKFNLANKVSYVSVQVEVQLLEYFEGKELPGIAAVNE